MPQADIRRRFAFGQTPSAYFCLLLEIKFFVPRNPPRPFSVENITVNEIELGKILDGCRQNKRASQQRLFALFYNYAMTVARRYTGNPETAEEVVNDAFFKVFTKIHYLTGEQPFRLWLRRIVINTAIDRFRSQIGDLPQTELQTRHDVEADSGIVEDLTREQIFSMIDRLPPAYRAVFNLFTVDGFSHEEIAQALQISVGTSKSNLARARQHLKTLFYEDFEFSGKI